MKTIEELYDAYLRSAGVSTDTRTIGAGTLFVALKGANFDANTMIGSAFERGAAYVVTTDKTYAGDERAFVCDDTLKALQQLAHEHRKHLKIPVIGITGTNGKTTTKELVTAVLRKKYKTYATEGNHNNHIGVPLTLLSIKEDAEMAVVEMGANHPGEIKTLVDIANPTIGLITNVGIAHIEGFGSFEGVKKTKGEMYDYLRSVYGEIAIDTTNSHLVGMLGEYSHALPYVEGKVERDGRETITVSWKHGDTSLTAHTNLTGEYNLANVLAAVTMGTHFGVSDPDIVAAISEYKPTNSRSQIVQTKRNHLIVDAYNANPSSMAAALDNLEHLDCTDKAVILGAMRELGQEQDPQHIAILSRLKTMGLKSAILIGPEFKKFAGEYPEFRFFDQTDEARDAARSLSGLNILVKGSNSNKLTTLVEDL